MVSQLSLSPDIVKWSQLLYNVSGGIDVTGCGRIAAAILFGSNRN